MFEMLASYTHKRQRRNVYVVSLSLPHHSFSRSPGNLQRWNFQPIKAQPPEARQDQMTHSRSSLLPAPGKPAKWSLRRPLPMQACHQLTQLHYWFGSQSCLCPTFYVRGKDISELGKEVEVTRSLPMATDLCSSAISCATGLQGI